jgi:hypothetical protein
MAKYYILNSANEPIEVTLETIIKDEKLPTQVDVDTVKKMAEDKVKKAEDDLAKEVKRADDLLTSKVSAETSAREAEEKLKPLNDELEKLRPLETEITELKTKHGELQTSLLSNRRNDLIQKLGLDGDKKKEIETMDGSALDMMEKTLALVGVGNGNKDNRGRNFDRNDSRFDNDTKPVSAHKSIVQALENNALRTVGNQSAGDE